MIDEKTVDRALASIKRTADYVYFFDKLQKPDWIIPLREKGIFNDPPNIIQDGELINHPIWAQSRYLARVADKDPKTVYDTILIIPETENERIHEDFIKAACSMPHDLAASLARKEVEWIRSKENIFFRIPELVSELISKLAKEGEVDAAFELANSLFKILPEKKDIPEDWDNEFREIVSSQNPKARFDIWQYENVLKKCLSDLTSVAKIDALRLLCEQLENAIGIKNAGRGRGEGSEDYSYIWRPAIENHEQNRPEDITGILVTMVRDCAEMLIEINNGKAVLEFIENRSYKVNKRIGLYLRRKYPDVDNEGTAHIITDQSIIFDSDFRYEFFHLLREQFPHFSADVKKEYLNLIGEGIDLTPWIELYEEAEGKKPKTEKIEREKRRRKYQLLLPIRSYLEDEWIEEFENLKEEFGEVDQPDFSFHGTSWVGPTSPKSVDDLRSMKDDELITFLKEWKPTGEPQSESKEGLSRTLSAYAKEDSARFATLAERFKDLEPPYIRGMLSGLRDAIRDNKTYEWPSILDLCHWVVNQGRTIPGYKGEYGEGGWEWTRRGIADLVSTGLSGKGMEIPFEFKDKVWAIIKPLTEDPEPDEEYEKQYGGSNMDPVTLSINTVRGEAMHAVMQYALWIRRDIDKSEDPEERVKHGFKEMPEVKKLLDRHLDFEHENTLTIRSTYGKWFPWLVLLDPEWSKKNVPTIFPHEDSLIPYFDAAWDAYISFCKPYKNVFPYLKDEYKFTIENISRDRVRSKTISDPEKRLTEHLMTFYWFGELVIAGEDSLLRQFFSQATAKTRGYAIVFIGLSLLDAKTVIKPEILDSLQTLWEWRIREAGCSKNPKEFLSEFEQFGGWFASGRFDDDWALCQLNTILKFGAMIDWHIKEVLQRFVELLDRYPEKTIECIDMMIVEHQEGVKIYYWCDEIKEVLQKALKLDIVKSRVEDIVHRLGAMGFLEFRDLLGITL